MAARQEWSQHPLKFIRLGSEHVPIFARRTCLGIGRSCKAREGTNQEATSWITIHCATDMALNNQEHSKGPTLNL
ncbi:hypothetical protein MRX96_037253 [Rhipicephalus microplus]